MRGETKQRNWVVRRGGGGAGGDGREQELEIAPSYLAV